MWSCRPAVVLAVLFMQSLELCQGFAVKTMYHVYTSVQFRFATTDIKCVIRNTDTVKRNLPFLVELPSDAFIVKFSMATGGKTYIGEIKERTFGSQVTFDDGGSSSNVQGSRDGNKFGVSLPVAGGENATYNLVYQERLRRLDGVYEHRLHLKLDQIVENLYVETYIWEDKDIIKMIVPVMRPLSRINADYGNETNPLAVTNRLSSNRVQVIFAPSSGRQGSRGLSHLFLVQYDVVHNPDGDVIVKDGFFIHFFAPDTKPLPKDIIFVIDKSGSMSWANKMEQMIEAMVEIMDDIPTRDHFNIVPFDSSSYEWKPYLVPATAVNINEAKQYIRRLPAYGGTNIRDGIITARNIFLRRSSTERVAMIFFLTDGQDRAILDDFPSIPIYGLAFGDDADLDYIKELCAKNAGFSQKIYTEMDAANQVKNFYDKISSVSMKKITFKYDPNIVDLTSLTATEFSLVVKGSEVLVIGRLKKNVTNFNAHVEIEGEYGKIVKVAEMNETQILESVPKEGPGKSVPGSFKGNMEKVWALTTIQNLLQEDEKKATTKGSTEKLQQALYLSVKYGFVSPLTSIVINDPDKQQQIVETAVKDAEEKLGDRVSEFIKSRPSTTTVTTTTTTTTTTTMMPKCRPNTTIDEAVKSDLLTLTNMSGIYEHCMNIKPGASKYLKISMKSLGRFKGMPKLKQNQANNKTHVSVQRTVEINSFNVHYRERVFCVHPVPRFEAKSSYLIVACPKGQSLYLFTGSIYKLRSANAERLLILSTSKIATFYLGTTTSWQIMGDLEFQSEVNGSSEINLRVSCFNLTVQRNVNQLGLTYDVTVYLDDASKFTGLVMDNVNNKEAEPNICAPLQDEDRLLLKYRQNGKKFMTFFLEMLFDLIKNFPLRLWE
ncbi:Inter-alpha-trypsin inhibitor heavy chain H4 [Bulinus truncatus]|nr:Inter-alpha-trypsin inhibitor heavy chain H4 [Bulinus truncatus]